MSGYLNQSARTAGEAPPLSDALDDPVSRFLLARGQRPHPYTFEDSDWVVGCQVEFSGMHIMYRVEGDTVVIGELSAGSSSAREGGMHAFIAFAHALSRVPGLKRIKGMILTGSDAETQTQRKRLAALLEAQGAHWVEENGERWLIYPLQRDDVSYH